MKKCLPGPFTFILYANANITRLLNSRRKTIGVRIPDNPVVLKILENMECPIVSSSLHDEDEIVKFPTDPNEIFRRYNETVDMVINGGHGNNEESTIIDCTAEEPMILRQGAGLL
jgi:tRNA threonylcarbamoyl adenosine modification protein (Sua5/YciO/YrdC/YwlC family)